MIDRMDQTFLALQAAATARKLYGLDHPVVKRQVDLAAELLVSMLNERKELRVVRLDLALLFDAAELPSNAHLAEVLCPRLAAHRIEWLEFRRDLVRPELVTLLDQLERAPAELMRSGPAHIRVGRIGGAESNAGGTTEAGTALPLNEQVSQFKELWCCLRGNGRPDQ